MAKEKRTNKSKWLWSIAFVLLAAASVYTVMTLSKGFTLKKFMEFVSGAKLVYVLCAFVCMLLFIFFEGAAVRCICRSFGHECGYTRGFVYSATDIYFSAITPSATGGQPMCAYVMMSDKIPGVFTTFALVINLMMYTSALLSVGILCFIIHPELFGSFSIVSRVMILVGFAVQTVMLTALFLLMKNEKLLKSICRFAIGILKIIGFKKLAEKLYGKLDGKMSEYAVYASMVNGKRRMLVKVYLCNLLQRMSQLFVTVFMFIATGGAVKSSVTMWFLQGYVALGSNSVPIPGSVGATDYLMVDGFGSILSQSGAANLELVTRFVSFYVCVIVSGIIFALNYIIQNRKKKGE